MELVVVHLLRFDSVARRILNGCFLHHLEFFLILHLLLKLQPVLCFERVDVLLLELLDFHGFLGLDGLLLRDFVVYPYLTLALDKLLHAFDHEGPVNDIDDTWALLRIFG